MVTLANYELLLTTQMKFDVTQKSAFHHGFNSKTIFGERNTI